MTILINVSAEYSIAKTPDYNNVRVIVVDLDICKKENN